MPSAPLVQIWLSCVCVRGRSLIRGPPRCLLNKRAAEEIRKQEWLSEEVGEVGHSHVPLCLRSADKYGLDLDEFKMKTGRKGKDFKECVKVAEWICIDEMRGLCRPQYSFCVF